MRKVTRAEIVDYATYEDDVRPKLRPGVLEAKQLRRVHVGPHLTFHFENHETVRYQIQEMMRVERIVKEADIAHEIETYNELIGDAGELGCTLMIEIDDPVGRTAHLTRWRGLNETLYALLPDGRRVPAKWDARQVGDDRLSAVQYLRFDTGGVVPVAIGCAFDDAMVFAETKLSPELQAALAADLAE